MTVVLIYCHHSTVPTAYRTIVLLDEMPVYNTEFLNVKATLGIPDWGTCYQVSQIIGLLQATGHTFMYWGNRGEGKCVCNGASVGHPLKCKGT